MNDTVRLDPPDPREPADPQATLILPRRRSRRALVLAIAGGVTALGLGVWLVTTQLPQWLSSPVTPAPAPVATPGASAAPTRKVQKTLFYVSDAGTDLVPASRDVDYGQTPAEQARFILDAQVQTPPEGFVSAIPAGTAVRAVYLTAKGDAFVDFGAELVSAHPGGSLAEALAVYTIVNALTVNLAEVTGVRILVDGKEVDTLAGHFDLRRPLVRSLAWVRKGQ